MVNFARAEPRQLAEDLDFAGDGQVAQPSGAEDFAKFAGFQARLVGHRDQLFAFGLVRSRDHRQGEPQPILWKCSGQGVFDGGQAHHLTTDLGETF